MNTAGFDSWVRDGCGRCEKYQTPRSKVLRWTAPIEALRQLVLAAGLHEEMKWGNPCYTLDGRNVLMIGALQGSCCLSFFQGALLDDPQGLLVAPGPNSQAARMFTFTTLDQVQTQSALIRACIEQAMALSRAGARVEFRASPEPMPEELRAALDADADLKAAFESLTPGRQRSHILHVSGAKQPSTRQARVAKCAPKILAGKGFLDR